MRIIILGRFWNLKFVPNLGKYMGLCEDPTNKNRTIKIQKGLTKFQELQTILHECGHAINYKMFDEEFIEEVSTNIAKILWDLGYRKTDGS